MAANFSGNCLLCFAIVVTAPLASVHGAEQSNCQLNSPRCEYLVNPLGLDETVPRLSWTLSSPQRGARQAAYQILAASSPELLAQDQGDLWDTGKVASAETVGIEYAGKPLTAGQQVWWKVRAWDQDGHVSPWSEVASWEMALLARSRLARPVDRAQRVSRRTALAVAAS